MSVFVNKDTKVIVQGITGSQGLFHTKQMIEYGTNIVGGVTPGKGGTEVEGVPVFDTVSEAVEKQARTPRSFTFRRRLLQTLLWKQSTPGLILSSASPKAFRCSIW